MKYTALVTGANRGIGLEIARGIASQGHRVLMGVRNIELGQEAATGLEGLDVHPVLLDLADDSGLSIQIADIQREFGDINILVNNAGILENGEVMEISLPNFASSLQVNLTAPLQLIQSVLPAMIDKGFGRIVNLSSGWGSFYENLEGPVAYSVSKAALNALTVTGARNLPDNIKMNAMCPGWVHTRMGGEQAPLTPAQGADTAVWLALLDKEGPNGGFFRGRKPIQW